MTINSSPALSVALLQTWPVRIKGGGDADVFEIERAPPRAAPRPDSDLLIKARMSLISGNLRIEADNEAGCFVQTLTDARTMEVLRRFPHESQLAYSRAIGAYMNARAARF